MISDKELFGFKWPPKGISYPFKKKKHYSHNIVVVSLHDPDVGFVLNFTSEAKARATKRAMGEALNAVTVEYERKELPVMNEDGVIL